MRCSLRNYNIFALNGDQGTFIALEYPRFKYTNGSALDQELQRDGQV